MIIVELLKCGLYYGEEKPKAHMTLKASEFLVNNIVEAGDGFIVKTETTPEQFTKLKVWQGSGQEVILSFDSERAESRYRVVLMSGDIDDAEIRIKFVNIDKLSVRQAPPVRINQNQNQF